jgi:hypothetical protein
VLGELSCSICMGGPKECVRGEGLLVRRNCHWRGVYSEQWLLARGLVHYFEGIGCLR